MDPRAISKRPAAPPPNTVGMVEEADVCQTLADYHGTQGRILIGILMRPYLESHVLTATEVIHHHKHLKAIVEQGQLVENAVVKVANVQARQPGQDPKARRMAIQNAIIETQTRARGAQVAFAEMQKTRSPIEAVLAAPAGKSPTQDFEYDLRVALSMELAEHRSWPAKIDHLVQLMQWERDERLSAAVDGVLADIVCTPAAMPELFGAASLLGPQLANLCELAVGRTTIGSAMGPNRAGVINALIRQGKLPQTQAAVLDRVRRQLRSPQPLGRGGADEPDHLRTLMGHLVKREGVVGEGPMAEALTIRYSRRLEQGGASAFRRSLLGISESINDLFARIHYLSAVSTVAAAEKHQREICEAIEAALGNELLVEGVVLNSPDIGLVREGIASGVQAIARSALPEEDRARLARRLAYVVDEFAQRGRLVQRLRHLEPVLRRRIIRLAELATSGLVREEGALPLMRQHVLEVVKQPQFQTELVAQQNSEVAQAEVRRLYELLDKLRQAPAPGVPTRAMEARPAGPAETTTATRTVETRMGTPTIATVPVPQGMPTVAPTVAPTMAPTMAPTVAPTTMAVPPTTGTRVVPNPTTMVTAATASAPITTQARASALSMPSEDDGRCPACFEPRATSEACGCCGYPTRNDNRAGVHLTPGTLLHSRYKVGRLLGQGGFGATYLGWDDRLHVKVAVKEYFPSSLISRAPGTGGVVPFSDEHAKGFTAGLRKFLEEARTLARLREIKEIVGVQDFFEENATAYLIMELLEGRTLKRYIADSGGKIDPKRAVTILTPIIKALQSVHDQGLIHRDISPDNIFITAAGERKLLDFGAARQAAGQSTGMTVILKPGYAPPEQYSPDGKQGPWTDVYAMCATIYCALCGRPPTDATARFMNDTVAKPSAVGVKVPATFEAALMQGLAMRWQDRPQSMRDLLKGLSAAVG